MKKTIANLFIIGFPKSGTTSLANYLGVDYRISLSDPKEPHFFLKNSNQIQLAKTFEEYSNFFKKNKSTKYFLDASTNYIYSIKALKLIKENSINPKIIIMLRNPVDMILSMHQQFLQSMDEDQEDFMNAWKLQDRRRRGFDIPKHCRYPQLLQYENAGKISRHVERAIRIFGKRNIYFVEFDFFISEPKETLKKIYEFIDLTYHDIGELKNFNPSKQFRNLFLKKLAYYSPRIFYKILMNLRNSQKFKFIPIFLNMLFKANYKNTYSHEIYTFLEDKFIKEISKVRKFLK